MDNVMFELEGEEQYMADNDKYVIKVPKTPPKEQLEHWQDYHILVEEESLPNGDVYLVHYEVFWDAEDELFYLWNRTEYHRGRLVYRMKMQRVVYL